MDLAREIALKGIFEIEQENAYSNLVLEKLLKQYRNKITEKDVGFISELIYGVTTWKLTLDVILQKYSNIKLKKVSKWGISILRLGAYQILFLDKVPPSAAVNESVNLAKKYASKSAGFINAVLRKVKKEDRAELEKEKKPIHRISIMTSMPEWIVEELAKEYSLTQVEEICKNSNEKAKVSIRVNRLKSTKEELIKKLEEREIEVKQGRLPDFLILENIKNIANLDLYREGYFTLQDEAAGLAALILQPEKGDLVLDACSAPGGKTTYLAEQMQNEGKIVAWDVHESRVKMVKENAERLGIGIIETEVQDASRVQEGIEHFDKILVDVPCMGLGVMRRKPDIKWQKKKEDIKKITKVQYEILQNVSHLLKKNGKIVYSTCSILQEENDAIIKQFLEENPDFTVIPIEEKSDFKNQKEGIGFTLLPDEEKDGFYICMLSKG